MAGKPYLPHRSRAGAVAASLSGDRDPDRGQHDGGGGDQTRAPNALTPTGRSSHGSEKHRQLLSAHMSAPRSAPPSTGPGAPQRGALVADSTDRAIRYLRAVSSRL